MQDSFNSKTCYASAHVQPLENKKLPLYTWHYTSLFMQIMHWLLAANYDSMLSTLPV